MNATRHARLTKPPPGQRALAAEHLASTEMREPIRVYVETSGPHYTRVLITTGYYLEHTFRFRSLGRQRDVEAALTSAKTFIRDRFDNLTWVGIHAAPTAHRPFPAHTQAVLA